ncbi:MAG: hypothetical protein E7591_05360 [Ruminococcaceae bacterium]|nr:hypothetical protein [Oscillospiraceae bacterium]
MKWFLYYAVSLAANITVTLLFKNYINIEPLSVVPVFLLMLSAFIAVYYYTNRSKEDFGTNYYSDIGFTDEEWEKVCLYTCRFNAGAIPIYIPFVLFFSPIVKAIVPTLIFMIAMVGGVVFFRIKYRKSLYLRFCEEKKELETQKKLEESGRWK